MEYAHKNVYAPEGKWTSGDWFSQPDGIKRMGNELFPSWYEKNQNQTQESMVFDRVSKKKATECTPEAAKITITVTKVIDPTNNRTSYVATDDYDATSDDDVHSCNDAPPSVGSISVQSANGNKSTINVTVEAGSNTLRDIAISVNGRTIATVPATASGTYKTTYEFTDNSTQTISATVTDSLYYTGSSSTTHTPTVNRQTTGARND